MNLTLFPGKVLVARDPMIARSHKGIWFSDREQKLAAEGLCVLHEPGSYWDFWGGEAPLTGRRITFVKFAGRPVFLIGPGGQGLELWVLPEDCILAVEEAE